jgi:sugar lactone lactonase YvrE
VVGGALVEGPAWFAAGRCLVWSDIPNNRMMRFVVPSGEVSVFRERSNNSNGNTVDDQGRLVRCERLTRRVTRTENAEIKIGNIMPYSGSASSYGRDWKDRRGLFQENQAGNALAEGAPGRGRRTHR